MKENVITAELKKDQNGREAYEAIHNSTGIHGYEIYEMALVKGEELIETSQRKFTLSSHSFIDLSWGALCGVLFGLRGFLLGSFLGLLTGLLYDARQHRRDIKLIKEACTTLPKEADALILIANESYEDALDHQLHAYTDTIHRAYASDLKEEIRIRHNFQTAMH
jgi:uncharacterized membrane protein